MRTVLIDGDILLYRCGFAAEHIIYRAVVDGVPMTFEGKAQMNTYIKEHTPTDYEWESELQLEPLAHCLSTVKNAIKNIVLNTAADDYVVYLSGKKNFRENIATVAKYKGNRDDKRKPMYFKEILQYLYDNHPVEMDDNMEADDLLAKAQTKDTVIASLDKDLLQIPGKHYNFVTGEAQIVRKAQGRKKLYEQMLTGDKTDNIPGIYKMGPVTANKLLDATDPKEWDDLVRTEWIKYFTGKNAPEWLVDYSPIGDDIVYHHWSGTGEVESTVTDFLKEIRALVEIGTHDG